MNGDGSLWFWSGAAAVAVLVLWVLSPILLPFAAAAVVAYLLDPLVDRCESRMPRGMAAFLVLLLFLVAVVLVLLLIVPLLYTQLAQLVAALPGYATQLTDSVVPLVTRLLKRLPSQDVASLRAAAGDTLGDVVAWLGTVLTSLVSQGFAVFDVLSLLFITPVVSFYLLRDWDHLVARVDTCVPLAQVPTVRRLAVEVDLTLHGFLHGQAIVCLALGVFYAVLLTVVGLDYALVIGFMAGLLSFIPYLGSLFGFISSVGFAYLQFHEVWMVGLVAGIFLLGQAIEGNYLQPKMVGDRVNLHPVWVMFAILAGGQLLGFLGVLIAVPAAAVIGVLVRFALARYLESVYYRGDAEAGACLLADPGGEERR